MSKLLVTPRANRSKTRLLITLCLVTIMVVFGISTGYHENIKGILSYKSTDKPHIDTSMDKDKQVAQYELIESQILDIAKSLERAKMHARGTKTSDELRRAISVMYSVLKTLGIDENLMKRKVFPPKSVCPEEYKGTNGKEYSWFNVTDCAYGKPLWKLITIVTYFKEINETEMKYKAKRFLNSMYNYDMFKVVLATKFHYSVSEKLSRRVTVQNSLNATDGNIWNKLVSAVKTPYVLIARNIDVLTQDAMLERLVREMESLQVAAVAGAVRYQDDHWKRGCYQSVYRNYSLKYIEGYDESLHECLFCDYTFGPFLTSVEHLNILKFAELDENEGLFEDWFLRLNKKGLETIVCPDSMFNIYYSEEASTWPRFMKHWKIYKVISPQGQTILSACEYYNKKVKTKSLSPCAVQSNADLVKLVLNMCDENRLFCMVRYGTLLGALKFEKVLPWDTDADIICPTLNFSSLTLALNATSNYTHLKFRVPRPPQTCKDNRQTGGKLVVYYEPWGFHVDVVGLPLNCDMPDEMTPTVDKPTMVLFDGHWVTAPHNPGLDVRNVFGLEIYKHVQHYRPSQLPYIPGIFKPCETPNDHDCLDRYSTDGDMSFKECLP